MAHAGSAFVCMYFQISTPSKIQNHRVPKTVPKLNRKTNQKSKENKTQKESASFVEKIEENLKHNIQKTYHILKPFTTQTHAHRILDARRRLVTDWRVNWIVWNLLRAFRIHCKISFHRNSRKLSVSCSAVRHLMELHGITSVVSDLLRQARNTYLVTTSLAVESSRRRCLNWDLLLLI